MSEPADRGSSAGDPVAIGVRATYDRVASTYDEQLSDELSAKPLDRALLSAFVELVGEGTIADVGCGPGHVTRHLAERHPDVIGIDLSPGMIDLARAHAPGLTFTVGSMLELPAADDDWAGAIALYSIIHLTSQERATACRELARTLHPGGWLMVAFHVDSPEFVAGATNHLTTWFGESVDLDAYFLDPADVVRDLEAAGFVLVANLLRQPSPEVEYPSRRCYLLAQQSGQLSEQRRTI
jgi:SAM-dependent methyltransferase